MKYYFTSDSHFGHGAIIKYCHRPFADVQEMDGVLIRNWNQRVKPDDTVIHLGDFCFERCPGEAPESKTNAFLYYKSQLNGNIILIKGNHDGRNKSKTIIQNATIKYGGYKFFCVHNPEYYNPKLDFTLCGHVHGREGKVFKRGNTICVDLSVDNWNFMPVSIQEIDKEIKKFIREQKYGKP